jgi:maleamate amidohydrolase
MKRPLSVDTSRMAALFVDMQEEHRQDARYLVEGFDKVLSNVQRLQNAARAAKMPLFHFAYIVDMSTLRLRHFHPVTENGQSAFSDASDPLTALCPETEPAAGEELLVKTEASAFGDGRLEQKLEGVEWVMVSGVWTEACIDATVKGAVARGLRVLLVKDACGSGSQAMHQTGILNLANRLYGGAVTDTDGACRLLAGAAVDVWMVEGSVPLRYSYENAAEIYEGL